MKKIMRLAIGVLMAMNVFTATAFAAVPSLDYTSINQESKLCDNLIVRGLKNPMQEEETFLWRQTLL